MISHFQIVSTPNLYSNETDELQSFEKKNMFQNFFMFQIFRNPTFIVCLRQFYPHFNISTV